ncbi:glycosyltransferase family 2 protein [Sphingomonas jatrophae]|uniref:Glycosyl transferase family 2 n=1 Tax=Sphingomonas jatrophae TaxID=1166337 RepID=A0A1I6L6H6_9SPHN|nr:glycosyltransferase [Sphingomonas jatrophae]SFR99085.1 Glycosyl transferase family 2 [Sphingomonas jatrophae]
MPVVSVVIPTARRPAAVCRAVATVLAQTMADLEVIVVVDGDDPATDEALGAVPDQRLRVIHNGRRRGAGEARNIGADAARGAWVAFLDDDDEWLPTKLAAQLAAAPAEPAIVMTQYQVVGAAGTFIRPTQVYDEAVPFDEWLFDRQSWTRSGEGFIQSSSLMVPKALFSRLRFTTKQHEDWEFVLRAVKQHGHRLVTVAEPLVVYYAPDTLASLSGTHTWQRSIAWGWRLRRLMSPRGFSGYCLTVAAQMAATRGTRRAFGPLLKTAFAHGAPTAKQLFAFVYFWLSPVRFRHRLRAWMQAERG